MILFDITPKLVPAKDGRGLAADGVLASLTSGETRADPFCPPQPPLPRLVAPPVGLSGC